MTYIFSKHEYDLLKKLSGKFYDEYDDRIRLGWDHVVREVPNGTKNEIFLSAGKMIKRVSDVGTIEVGDGLTYLSHAASINTYLFTKTFQQKFKNVKTNTIDSIMAFDDNGVYDSVGGSLPTKDVRGITLGSLINLRIEVEKIDAESGSTLQEKFDAYISKHPITLWYQLNVAEDVPLPVGMDPNTVEICRMSEQLDNLVKSFIAGGGTMI